MMQKRYARVLTITFLAISVVLYSGCKKFLDTKPSASLEVPSSLADLQALFDNGYIVPNQDGTTYDEAAADNYYCPEANLDRFPADLREAYVWQNFVTKGSVNDWQLVYELVNISNIALQTLKTIDTSNTALKNNVEGSAYFYRAWSNLHGVVIYALAYDSATAATDPGICLPNSADDPAVSRRSSVQETYDKIIADLQQAIALLPDHGINLYRPSKAAAFALLARTMLATRNYAAAFEAAKNSLTLQNALLDYNQLDSTSAAPVPQYSEEEIFHATINQPNYYTYYWYYSNVDSNVVKSFDSNDLRRVMYLDFTDPENIRFKGNYSPGELFDGLATDEMWLTRAECEVRMGQRAQGLATFNEFMNTRWRAGTFEAFDAATDEDALQQILRERRKELLFRNIRWMDIKRLNKEGANISLERVVGGQSYVLPPNDPRFALPIPQDIINKTGMVQNPH